MKRGQKPKHDEEIIRLRNEGKTAAEIAAVVDMSEAGIHAAIKRLGLKGIQPTEKRVCVWCGKEFDAVIWSNKKYCSTECERNRNHHNIKPHNDNGIKELVEERQPDWEYIDGYTGSDGRMNLRHKACGTVYSKSSSSVRHRRNLSCPYCSHQAQLVKAKEKSRKKRRIAKIVKRINKPDKKKEQIQMKTCPDCGAFYFSIGKVCKDCAKKRDNRYSTRKKDLKKKGSYTKESKLISARTLYKRDNGICWICGGKCDIDADPNSDWYPSVDHIMPQSLGGKDTLDNVRLAHRKCNTIRSNNVSFIPPNTAISLSS